MDRRQSLIYNLTGQDVEMYPPEWTEGVPSSATYKIWMGTEGLDVATTLSGNATTDAVSTTVDVASGYSQANRKKVSLASTTSIAVGRYYLLENASQQRELVRVESISSGDHVIVEHDLAYDYAITTSTLKGLRQYFTIDATFIADLDNLNPPDNPWKVEWSYTVNSISRKHFTYFDVVRIRNQHNVTGRDLAELFPDLGLKEWAQQRGSKFDAQIDAAEERVRVDFLYRGIHWDEIRDGQIRDELIRSCALMLIAEAGIIPANRDPETWVVERRQKYNYDLENTKQKIDLDKGRSGAISPGAARQLLFTR